jgi:2,3-bisphosphoglycerate-independent phosphoglycerate mutase
MNISNFKLIYVLLDGIGDLPHPLLGNSTPLQVARTPNLDMLTSNGCMGNVISVGKGIAPQSDIAVFNMLGYTFKDGSYVGRGVIESIGCNIDFREGDLALRGNFATISENLRLADRRAGRRITREEAQAICETLRDRISFTDNDASVVIEPTISHRVIIRLRHSRLRLSENITNTDPAYDKINGIGVAKATSDQMVLQRSLALDETENSKLAAKLVNEFSDQAIGLLKNHPINKERINAGKSPMNAILLRDPGSRYPKIDPIGKKYSAKVASMVDMPVEIGISKVLDMKTFEAGEPNDYEEKASRAARIIEDFDILYIHIKGPDEFGHDGDPKGKTRNIEEIDNRFFGNLLDSLKVVDPTIVVSGDHSTPCINKAHTDDPVPLLISGNRVIRDNSARFTESYASKGKLGLLMGESVLSTAISIALKG